MFLIEAEDEYIVIRSTQGHILGRCIGKGRVVTAVKEKYFLIQEDNTFISFETKLLSSSKESKPFKSLELGRYKRKGHTFLDATEEFYLLQQGPWYITIDPYSQGIARDNMGEPLVGIRTVTTNYEKKEQKDLIGFQHGIFIYFYDKLFNLITIEKIE